MLFRSVSLRNDSGIENVEDANRTGVDESVETIPRGVSFASIPFFLSLTLIQARRSSESSPAVQQDTLAGNGLERQPKHLRHSRDEFRNTTYPG